jgi:hypothetical protein
MSTTADRLTREQWATILGDLEAPAFGEVVAAIEEADMVDADPEATVDAAINDGQLVEDADAGILGTIKFAEPKREEPAEEASNPGGETAEPDDSVDKYRRIYLDAADRAGRETWEYVEEWAIRDALDAAGFAELLTNGTLFEIRDWRLVDVSDSGEEPRRRWYYASGDEPRPAEFRRFHELLTDTAPDDYTPHYFRVAKVGKDPATQFGSWKTDEAELTVDEAVAWMEEGGNIGIAARGGCQGCGGRASPYCPECEGEGCDDGLVNVDIDDDEETTPEDVPASLRARSRSRTGWHTWYFSDDEIPNIPTDEFGEVRSQWQYVLAPGSFVASRAEEIPDDADSPGYYTVEDADPVASIEYDDLPEVFHDAAEAAEEEAEEDADDTAERDTFEQRETTGERNAVFDVDAEDLVTGKDASDRFSSIFHGSGTGANMSVSDGKLHCWRHGVAHGGLQALATLSNVDHVRNYGCKDLGAGHKNSGAGSNRLKGDWRLVWGAWHEAKQRGAIPDDEPIPYNVLVELAVADGLVDREELVERDSETGEIADDETAETYTALPPATYAEAIQHVEEEYGVDSGREYSTRTADDADPVAAIGVEKLEALDPDDQRRAAKKRGHEIPTTREARQRLRDAIFREIRNGNTTVLDAPTALGKSYTVATEPWLRRQSVTGGAPVIHLHQTCPARDEAAAETADSMATGEVLLGRKEASPVARGDHDPVSDGEDPDVVVTVDGEPASEWFDRMCDEKGLAFSTALAIARERNDQQRDELPPFGEDDPAVAQWDNVPRDDDGEPAADVIHATHQFAHVPSMRTNTNIVLDEQPDFRVELGQDRIRRMVIAYLKEIDAPTTSFEAFVSLAGNDQTRGDAAAERDAIGEMLNPEPESPATEWYVEEADAHALAPGIAKAIWNAIGREEADRNGRRSTKVYHEPPRFDADGTDYAAGTWLSVVIDDDNTIQRVRETPDLRQARAVVGLDAHPSMPLWELNSAPGMTADAVLDATERRLWRRFERGLTVVQVGEATRPRSGSKATEWMNDDRVRAVMNRLREHYGTGFKTALSTVQTERRVRDLLDEVAGGSNIDDENTMHFGEEKSRNDFADEEAGYVYGCMDPGDEMVLDTLAELGLDATPETAETNDGEEYRAQGRGFEGDDDETAAAVLASVRENHVAQAAGRYARNADEDRDATVYLHTDAAPSGFVDIETPGVEWIATDTQRDVIDELTDREEATAKEIADAVECSKQHVRDTLSTLEDRGLVARDRGAGYNGADIYRDEDATDVIVDDGSTANSPLEDFSKWSLAIELRHAGDTPSVDTSAASNATPGGVSAADTPPDPSLSDGDGWR